MTTELKLAKSRALQGSIKDYKMKKLDLLNLAKQHVMYAELQPLNAVSLALLANEALIQQLEFEYNDLLQEVERERLEVCI
jgi:hypothetical protein